MKQEDLLELASEFKELTEKEGSDKFCVILYKTKPRNSFGEERFIDRIYQSVEEFEKRGIDRALLIPTEFGVCVELYQFD